MAIGYAKKLEPNVAVYAAKVAEIKSAVPAVQVANRPGRPASGKKRVTLLLDPEVIAKFKAAGEKGWQARMNEALKAAKV